MTGGSCEVFKATLNRRNVYRRSGEYQAEERERMEGYSKGGVHGEIQRYKRKVRPQEMARGVGGEGGAAVRHSRSRVQRLWNCLNKHCKRAGGGRGRGRKRELRGLKTAREEREESRLQAIFKASQKEKEKKKKRDIREETHGCK